MFFDIIPEMECNFKAYSPQELKEHIGKEHYNIKKVFGELKQVQNLFREILESQNREDETMWDQDEVTDDRSQYEEINISDHQSKDEAIITDSLNTETVGQGQYDRIANSTNADKKLQNTYLLGMQGQLQHTEMENKLTSVRFTSSEITTDINGSVKIQSMVLWKLMQWRMVLVLLSIIWFLLLKKPFR